MTQPGNARHHAIALLLATTLLSAACGNQPRLNIATPDASQTKALLQAEPLFSLAEHNLNLPEENLLALDAQMRFFVQENVPRVLSPKAKLSYLLDAMIRPSQLGLQYEPGITHNASGTFYEREGNCLSLSSLFIALAREAGLDAYYNEVTIPPSWDMISENSMAFYQHINAVVDFGGGDVQVVDLSVDNYDYHYPQTQITDQRAAAQHYNNRAVEFLNRDNTAEAYRHLRRALYLDPDAGHIWGNLGTVFRRDRHLQEAETAYTKALSLNANDQVALNNLRRLYQETGRKAEARALERLSSAFQRKNPYWHYSRAKAYYETGKFSLASHSIRTAIRLDGDEYRFYQMAALVYRRIGEYELAQEFAAKGAKLRMKDN